LQSLQKTKTASAKCYQTKSLNTNVSETTEYFAKTNKN